MLILFLFLVFFVVAVNIALNKPATSNSILYWWPIWTADKAVDGNRNRDIYCNSCLHTLHSHSYKEAFIRIDLVEVSTIARVEIYNRVPYEGQCRNGTKENNTIRE